MDIPILIEPVADYGFRAITGEPLHLETKAPTREQAISQLRDLVRDRLSAGAEVVTLQIEPETHPLVGFAGMLKGDPLLEPWKQAMAEYREARASEETHQ